MKRTKWLTEREVSQMTGISVSKLQKDRFYRRGLPYSKIPGGRLVRYDADIITAILSKNTITVNS